MPWADEYHDGENRSFQVVRAASRGKVLLLTPPTALPETLRAAIEHAGLGLIEIPDRDKLLTTVAERKPDLVILDPRSLGESLGSVRRDIIAAKSTETLPLIALTADTFDTPGVVGLSRDSSLSEAFLVIRATLRRERPSALSGTRAAFGFELDETKFRIAISGRTGALSKSELCMIGPFFDAPDAVFERLFLERLAFNTEHYKTGNRLIDFYLNQLRRHLKTSLGVDPIQSVRGRGYVLARR